MPIICLSERLLSFLFRERHVGLFRNKIFSSFEYVRQAEGSGYNGLLSLFPDRIFANLRDLSDASQSVPLHNLEPKSAKKNQRSDCCNSVWHTRYDFQYRGSTSPG